MFRPYLDLTTRRVTLLAAALLALLLLASACGTSSPAVTGPSAAHRAQAGLADRLTYVALGDSYTSAPLVPVTDVAEGCFRSSGNYPSLVARGLGIDVDDRSCGGARIRDLTASQWPRVPAQLAAVRPDVDLVTIGIGGNDRAVFTTLTRTCPALRAADPAGAPCRDRTDAGGKDSLFGALRGTRRRLAAVLAEVRQRAPGAQVLVVGYPQIIAADRRCRLLPLAAGDYAYAAELNLALNRALRGATQDSGAEFVDVYQVSRGHDICSSDPWVNGAVSDRRRAAAFHPFPAEQRAVAALVLGAVEG